MIEKEAWYLEALGYLQEPDLNDPESLWEFGSSLENQSYHVGYMIEVPSERDPENPSEILKWEEVKAGTLARGQVDSRLWQEIEEFGQNSWYLVSRDPYVWQIQFSGQYAILDDWSFFGLTSEKWSQMAESHGGDIRAEIQVAILPSLEAPKPPEVTRSDSEEAKALIGKLRSVRPPPSFATFLTQEWNKLKAFLNAFRLDDVGQVQRLMEREGDFEAMAREMSEANREAQNPSQYPIVSVPVGIYEYVLEGKVPSTRSPHDTEFENYR